MIYRVPINQDALATFAVPAVNGSQYPVGMDILGGASRLFIASVSAAGSAVLMFPNGSTATIAFPIGFFEFAWAIRQVVLFDGTGSFYRGD